MAVWGSVHQQELMSAPVVLVMHDRIISQSHSFPAGKLLYSVHVTALNALANYIIMYFLLAKVTKHAVRLG